MDVLQIRDCKSTYNSLVSIPNTNDTSLDTIRGLFKAYFVHKQFVDYMIELNATELVEKNWINQRGANHTFKKLLRFQDSLNFNTKSLFLLVRMLTIV